MKEAISTKDEISVEILVNGIPVEDYLDLGKTKEITQLIKGEIMTMRASFYRKPCTPRPLDYGKQKFPCVVLSKEEVAKRNFSDSIKSSMTSINIILGYILLKRNETVEVMIETLYSEFGKTLTTKEVNTALRSIINSPIGNFIQKTGFVTAQFLYTGNITTLREAKVLLNS